MKYYNVSVHNTLKSSMSRNNERYIQPIAYKYIVQNNTKFVLKIIYVECKNTANRHPLPEHI